MSIVTKQSGLCTHEIIHIDDIEVVEASEHVSAAATTNNAAIYLDRRCTWLRVRGSWNRFSIEIVPVYRATCSKCCTPHINSLFGMTKTHRFTDLL
jgi:hypothetical protein